jgi:murein DD-endopeptidase MepM/ murein hydrolase activator NlpD
VSQRRRWTAPRWIGFLVLLPSLLLAHHAESDEAGPKASPLKKSAARHPAKGAGPQATPQSPRAAGDGLVYVVRRGDTLSAIAARHGLRRAAVVQANDLADPDALKVAQRLVLPGVAPAAAAGRRRAGTAARRSAAAQAPGNGTVIVRVGPRRVPTQIVLGASALDGNAPDLAWPVEGPIASPMGPRRSGWHTGVDIKADRGTPFVAAAPGVVAFSGWARGYGRLIKIEHPDGFQTLYAHNLKNGVRVGDQVDAGDVIGTVGRTGAASGYHLHFEVRREGVVYDPLILLPERQLVARLEEEAPAPSGEPAPVND